MKDSDRCGSPNYKVTPNLKIAISRYPFRSLLVCFPPAISCMNRINCSARGSIASPSAKVPALKSIQPGLFSDKAVLVEILTVGINVPKGVPRPVVKSTMWQPEAANAVLATRSFPGALNRFKPLADKRSPYIRTSLTPDLPDFCVQPSDFSSRVEIPPALFPGEGFS